MVEDRIRNYLRYDPETGDFFWKIRRGSKRAGAKAGNVRRHKKGKHYVCISIEGRQYAAHCLAHFMMTGEWGIFPSFEIDHKDGDGENNSWSNLRKGTKSQNQANSRIRVDNSTGFKGVSFHKATGKFQARVQHNGKRYAAGFFPCPKEAHEAYIAKAKELFGNFYREG